MKKLHIGLYLLLFILINTSLWAQESIDQYAQIKTVEGDTYTGKILAESDENIIIKTTSAGELTITLSHIKRIKKFTAAQLRDGLYWFENPNATRNVYGPTGYGLKKGEGYYQNFYVLLNSVSYGFSDNFTIGAGIVPLTFGEGLIFSITPKFSFPIVENKFNIGTGVLYAHTFGNNLGIGYGVATFGSRDHNVTLGMGYGVVDDDWSKAPIITFCGMTRIARKFSLVSENWVIPFQNTHWEYNQNTGEAILVSENTRYEFFISYGIRFMTEQVTVDLAFVNHADLIGDVLIGIPLLGVVIPFGNK